MHTSRSLGTIGWVLALGLVLVAGEARLAPAVTEGAARCRVRNVTQGTRGHSLKRMVRRSHDGDRLVMRGTCGGTVVIATDIVIEGRGTAPTVTGGGQRRVVSVRHDARVVLKRLRVRRGMVRKAGAGILNRGWLALRHVGVRKNESTYPGGGVRNERGARLTIVSSRIIGNRSSGGGGVRNERGRVTVSGSTFASNDGGAIWNRQGRVTISGSVIRGNEEWYAGGIVNSYGDLTISDSTVSGNTQGGGIYSSGRATLTDSEVATNRGRGITANGGTVTLVRTTVSGNTAQRGGGIRVAAGCGPKGCRYGKVILVDSEVSGNIADIEGGGIHAEWYGGAALPEVTLQGTSSVHDNVPDDCVGTPAC